MCVVNGVRRIEQVLARMAWRGSLRMCSAHVAEYRGIRVGGRRVAWRWEALCDGLCGRVRAGIDTELCDSTHVLLFQPATKKLRNTYTRRFVHVNPGAINVKTGLGVIESLELPCPKSEKSAGD